MVEVCLELNFIFNYTNFYLFIMTEPKSSRSALTTKYCYRTIFYIIFTPSNWIILILQNNLCRVVLRKSPSFLSLCSASSAFCLLLPVVLTAAANGGARQKRVVTTRGSYWPKFINMVSHWPSNKGNKWWKLDWTEQSAV